MGGWRHCPHHVQLERGDERVQDRFTATVEGTSGRSAPPILCAQPLIELTEAIVSRINVGLDAVRRRNLGIARSTLCRVRPCNIICWTHSLLEHTDSNVRTNSVAEICIRADTDAKFKFLPVEEFDSVGCLV